MTQAYIYDGLRSPFGRHSGALSGVRPDDLAAAVISELTARNRFAHDDYEDVILGNTNQAGEDCRNVARMASLLSGLPESVAGITVNRLCGSGLAAAADAARCVRSGEGELFVVGGVESMSRAPLVMAKASKAFDRGQTLQDSTLGARFVNPKLEASHGMDPLAMTADNIGHELGIEREAADIFAWNSQQKYAAAQARGFFDEEIFAIPVPQGRGKDDLQIERDEHPRPDTVLEKLASLRPLFDGGFVTAGNASGINDGAAALLVGSREAGLAADTVPRARIVASAVAGVAPRMMGLGPVPAVKKLLTRCDLRLADIDVVEINEAFATQVLGCLKQLQLPFDDSRVNPNGGAIAIGHPLGASGARLLLTAMRQLEQQQGRYALISMCIGLGQGIATLIERCQPGDVS